MLVPSFAPEEAVELKGSSAGYFTDVWRVLFTNLLLEMQAALSNEGFVVPTLTASQITTVQNAINGNGNFTVDLEE